MVHDKNYKHVQHNFCVIDQMLIKQRTETTNCFQERNKTVRNKKSTTLFHSNEIYINPIFQQITQHNLIFNELVLNV